MYCKNCGQQLGDQAVVCVHCGAATDKYTTTTTSHVKPRETNVLAIIGFIFSFNSAIVGLICSIIGYRKAKQEGLEYGGLALAGIIISAVNMAISVLGMTAYILWIFMFVAMV